MHIIMCCTTESVLAHFTSLFHCGSVNRDVRCIHIYFSFVPLSTLALIFTSSDASTQTHAKRILLRCQQRKKGFRSGTCVATRTLLPSSLPSHNNKANHPTDRPFDPPTNLPKHNQPQPTTTHYPPPTTDRPPTFARKGQECAAHPLRN